MWLARIKTERNFSPSRNALKCFMVARKGGGECEETEMIGSGGGGGRGGGNLK